MKDVLNLDILLKGSPILTVEENTEIFNAVHHFITGSRNSHDSIHFPFL